MSRVLLFGGTTEGRSLAEYLERAGAEVLVCVATEYGESLMEGTRFRTIHTGRMDRKEMEALMCRERFAAVVDATHPYASLVSENVKAACVATDTEYLRLSRAREMLDGDVIRAGSMEEAAAFLAETKGNILVTTGTKELSKLARIPDFAERVYARVLPAKESIAECQKLGLGGSHIIGMQGPFEEALNEAMLRHIHAGWMLTKESGKQGGFAEKKRSARKAGASLVVITRPGGEKPIQEGDDELRIRGILCERLGISPKRSIRIIGIGMGARDGMTGEAAAACEDADVLIGAERMVQAAASFGKPMFISYRPQEIREYVYAHPEYERIGLLLSGDVGFYSGAAKLLEAFQKEETRLYPGISTVAYLCSRAKTAWEDVRLLSLHGRSPNLIGAVCASKKVFALTGGRDGVREICKKLLAYGLSQVKVTVGERLSYPQERILSGTPGELLEESYDGLCALLIQNNKACETLVHGLEDEAFLRGEVPMTKSEVRSVSLSRLRLGRNSIAYDVGAGTGSMAIEMAIQAWNGQVYAIERKPEAVSLIRENKRKFCADNLTVIEGLAPEALKDLPAPTHVFIGGSSGNLKQILETVLGKNPGTQIVLNAIALETVGEAMECLKNLPVKNLQISALSVSRSRQVGNYHMMMGLNPVYIISCKGGGTHA